MPVKYRFISD